MQKKYKFFVTIFCMIMLKSKINFQFCLTCYIGNRCHAESLTLETSYMHDRNEGNILQSKVDLMPYSYVHIKTAIIQCQYRLRQWSPYEDKRVWAYMIKWSGPFSNLWFLATLTIKSPCSTWPKSISSTFTPLPLTLVHKT